MTNYLILGATGFIGSHVAEELSRTGIRATALVRHSSDIRFLNKLDIQIESLEDFTSDTLASVMKGVDVVYNCIANVHPHQSLAQYRVTQVNLTKTIIHAAIKAGCHRLVQLSSIEVYGMLPDYAIDETYRCEPKYDFQLSLFEREQVLKNEAGNTDLDVVILRPAGTFGRRSALMKMFMDSYKKGVFPILGNGLVQQPSVDTRDIARAMIFLGKNKQAKDQIYNLQAYNVTMQSMVTELDKITGQTTKLRSLPIGIAKPLAQLLYWMTPFGKVPMITPFIVHISTSKAFLNDNKLRELGFETRYRFKDTLSYVLEDKSELYSESID